MATKEQVAAARRIITTEGRVALYPDETLAEMIDAAEVARPVQPVDPTPVDALAEIGRLSDALRAAEEQVRELTARAADAGRTAHPDGVN